MDVILKAYFKDHMYAKMALPNATVDAGSDIPDNHGKDGTD